MILLIGLVLLWILRNPGFVRGWAELFCDSRNVSCLKTRPKDSTAAMAVVLLMFMVPSRPLSGRAPLVDWSTVQKRLAWGLLLMRGGGFSIADAVEVSKSH